MRQVEIPGVLLPHQSDLYVQEPEVGRGPSIEALLGWWASGKTRGGAAKFARRVLQTPKTEAYGEDPELRPKSVVMGSTLRTVKRAVMPKLRETLPRHFVAREWKDPELRWELANGHDIYFVSAEGDFEGEDLCNIWADEFHRPQYAGETLWRNMMARLRDPHAPVLSLIVTGLPEAGFVRERLDPALMEPEDRVNRYLRLCGTDDNPFLDDEFVAELLRGVPHGMEAALRKGGWMLQPGSVFAMYNQAVHIVPDDEVDPNAPVHLALDVGQHSSAILGQDRPEKVRGITGHAASTEPGLLVVDEVLGEGLSVDALCTAVKLRPLGHRIIPDRSLIYADPTLRADEMAAVRRNFPGVRLVVRDRNDPFYAVEPGIRLVQSALLDGMENTRLRFCESVRRNRNGVLDAVMSARRSEKSGAVVKDDRTDHARDALRYLVQGRIGTKPRRGLQKI